MADRQMTIKSMARTLFSTKFGHPRATVALYAQRAILCPLKCPVQFLLVNYRDLEVVGDSEISIPPAIGQLGGNSLTSEGGIVQVTGEPAQKVGPNDQSLGAFLLELNICRKQVAAYPPAHPILVAAATKALVRLEPLLVSDQALVVGIARDALMYQGQILANSHPAFADLAKSLFEQGVATVSFSPGVTAAELLAFSNLLKQRSQPPNATRCDRRLAEAGVRNIQVQLIDYGNFLKTEVSKLSAPRKEEANDKRATLWEGFVFGLMEGTLDPKGQFLATAAEMDPEVAARLANSRGSIPAGEKEGYSDAINTFLNHVDREGIESQRDQQSLDRLALFIHKLRPELRRQIMSGVFGSLEGRKGLARKVLERFPDELIIEILEEVNAKTTYAPPLILGLLQRLGKDAGESDNESEGPPTEEARSAVPQPGLNQHFVAEGLRTIFREETPQTTLPDDYRQTLTQILGLKQADISNRPDLEQLRTTLVQENTRAQAWEVLQELLRRPGDQQRFALLTRSLVDIRQELLEAGEFSALGALYKSSMSHAERTGSDAVRSLLSDPQFLTNILDGQERWGKAKQTEITTFIATVGPPFIEPLLDRLAVEQSMALRRYHLDRLFAMGEAAREPALARLKDSRWYVVRNLLIILRKINDPGLLPVLRRLLGHPNPKVRWEALVTCLQFGDPAADELLLQNLDSSELSRRQNAVALAPQSKNLAVYAKLLVIIGQGTVTETDLELRLAVIRALGEIGRSETLPFLEKLLQTRNLLRSATLNRLKVETLRSLGRYPAAPVRQLLDRLEKDASGDMLRLIGEVRRSLPRGAP